MQALVTVPSEENLARVDFARMYTECEVKAVMKIKLRFFAWFEEALKDIVQRHAKKAFKKSKDQRALDNNASLEEASQEVAPFNNKDLTFHPHDQHLAVESNLATTICTEEDI